MFKLLMKPFDRGHARSGEVGDTLVVVMMGAAVGAIIVTAIVNGLSGQATNTNYMGLRSDAIDTGKYVASNVDCITTFSHSDGVCANHQNVVVYDIHGKKLIDPSVAPSIDINGVLQNPGGLLANLLPGFSQKSDQVGGPTFSGVIMRGVCADLATNEVTPSSYPSTAAHKVKIQMAKIQNNQAVSNPILNAASKFWQPQTSPAAVAWVDTGQSCYVK